MCSVVESYLGREEGQDLGDDGVEPLGNLRLYKGNRKEYKKKGKEGRETTKEIQSSKEGRATREREREKGDGVE